MSESDIPCRKVFKFGGSSLETPEKVSHAAETIKNAVESGNQIIAVVSAQGKTTDNLLSMASQHAGIADPREMDALLSCGENISAAIMAMVLTEKGCKAQSLNAMQAGIITENCHSAASIRMIDTDRVENLLSHSVVPVITGFQGITLRGDITTLGRGGSDTSAVSIAHWAGASECCLFSDVKGVYTADPSIVSEARLINELSYGEMLEMSLAGAGVIASEAIEEARNFGVTMHARSSFEPECLGTVITGGKMSLKGLKGITYTKDESRISLFGCKQKNNTCAQILEKMNSMHIQIMLLTQVITYNGKEDLFMVVKSENLEQASSIINEFKDHFDRSVYDNDIGSVSLIGQRVSEVSGIKSSIFSLLSTEKIPIYMVSETLTRIAIIVNASDIEKAVLTLHQGLGLSSS